MGKIEYLATLFEDFQILTPRRRGRRGDLGAELGVIYPRNRTSDPLIVPDLLKIMSEHFVSSF